jgi:transcriptional regulator with XRE-family HTH domain
VGSRLAWGLSIPPSAVKSFSVRYRANGGYSVRTAKSTELTPYSPGMATRLGSALRAARTARGLTLRDLEKLTGMSQSQLSQIETGYRADPSFSTVSKIAKAVGVSLDGLAGNTKASSAPGVPPKQIADLERAKSDTLKAASRINAVIDAIRNA